MYSFNIPLKDGKLIEISSEVIFYDPKPDEIYLTQDLEKSVVLTGINENGIHFGVTISLFVEDYLDLGIMDDFMLEVIAIFASNKEKLKDLTVDELTDEIMEHLDSITNSNPEVTEISSKFEYYTE